MRINKLITVTFLIREETVKNPNEIFLWNQIENKVKNKRDASYS